MKLNLNDTTATLVSIHKTHYRDGNPALQLELEWAGDPYPMPLSTISVNVPGAHLRPGEFMIKDYNEGEAMYKALVEAGIIKPTGQLVPSGHVQLPVCTLTEKANELVTTR